MSLQYATSLLEVLPQRLQPLVAMRDIINSVITVQQIQEDAEFGLGGYSNRPLQHFVDMTVGCAVKKWVEAKVDELRVAAGNPVVHSGGSADSDSETSSSSSSSEEESEWEEISELQQEEAGDEEGGGEAEEKEDGSEGEEEDDDDDEDEDDSCEGGEVAQPDDGAEEEQDEENA